MPSLEEAMRQSEDGIEQLDDGVITPVNDVFMINPETRIIEVPETERLFGVNFDKDVEKKYFKCPKIVGNNIDLSKHKIYVVYQKANENITTLMGEVGKYWCEDVKVDETGDYIEFSWLLSSNVLGEQGFIAFKVVAVYTDTETGELKTRWNTVPSVGLVRFTLSDGEEITEQYADIISQLLSRMDAVEDIATPEAMKGYVEQYFNEHPMELDETLTDSKKAAPANLVGQLKEDLNKLNDGGLNLKDEIIEEDINNWLNEHPEATTTVQDGSLSYKSFIFGELPFVTPEYFGAIGDGVTDDTNAIKQALSCSLPSNGYILFSPKTYCVSSVLDIANKNIIFNNCTLKRIANCTVVKFNEAKNFVLSDLHIEDDGNTYGIMVVGNHCENVEIRNVSICSNSPHTDTSAGNWATSLSGDRFHIKGLYINNYKSGLWADGLHFAYVSNSVIEDFVIISGDDSIAITQHEKGGTIFSNTLSENVRFVNGVLKSGNASAVRLGFDNSGVRKTEEISNCYHKNITFENIDCKTKYFIRIEYFPHDSNAVPVSDENINFYNVSFAPLGDVSTYPFFYVTKEYELKRWKFKDCKILCDIVTDEMTQSFFHTNCDDTNNDSKLVFDTCEFDFGCIRGFTGNYMKKLIFVGCDLRTNGKVIASIYGAYEFVNCNIINYGETEVDCVCTSYTTDSLKVHKVNGCVIDKFKQFCNVNDDGQTKLYINDCIYNTDSNIMNWYSGNANYNNVVKGIRRLISSEDMFVYVPANESISYDVSCCSYIKIRPLLYPVYTYDVVIRAFDSAIMSSKEKISEIKQMFTDAGLEVSIENSKVTLTNLTDTYKNVFIKFYSQTN